MWEPSQLCNWVIAISLVAQVWTSLSPTIRWTWYGWRTWPSIYLPWLPCCPGHRGLTASASTTPSMRCAYLVFSIAFHLIDPVEWKKTSSIQYSYEKCRARARVMSPTLAHGKSKNEIMQRNRKICRKCKYENESSWHEIKPRMPNYSLGIPSPEEGTWWIIAVNIEDSGWVIWIRLG